MLQVSKTAEYRGEIYAEGALAMYANASVSNGQIQYMNQNIQDWSIYMSHNAEIMQDFIDFQNQVMSDAQEDAQTVGKRVQGDEANE